MTEIIKAIKNLFKKTDKPIKKRAYNQHFYAVETFRIKGAIEFEFYNKKGYITIVDVYRNINNQVATGESKESLQEGDTLRLTYRSGIEKKFRIETLKEFEGSTFFAKLQLTDPVL